MPTGIYQRTQSHCDAISNSKKGKQPLHLRDKSKENHPRWKGNNVGYRALHTWVEKVLGKPRFCEECGKKGLKQRKYHWANISGKYKREISDWKRLCTHCHSLYDKSWLKKTRNKLGQFK